MTTYATLEDIENCMNNGWTDGLPVIPPYGSLVDEMLEAMGWQAQDIVGEIASQNIVVRAEKAAATAVMATAQKNLPIDALFIVRLLRYTAGRRPAWCWLFQEDPARLPAMHVALQPQPAPSPGRPRPVCGRQRRLRIVNANRVL